MSATRLFLMLHLLPFLAGAAPVHGTDGILYPASFGVMQCERLERYPLVMTGNSMQGMPTWKMDTTREVIIESCSHRSEPSGKERMFMPVPLRIGYQTNIYLRRVLADGTLAAKLEPPYALWKAAESPSNPVVVLVADGKQTQSPSAGKRVNAR